MTKYREVTKNDWETLPLATHTISVQRDLYSESHECFQLLSSLHGNSTELVTAVTAYRNINKSKGMMARGKVCVYLRLLKGFL